MIKVNILKVGYLLQFKNFRGESAHQVSSKYSVFICGYLGKNDLNTLFYNWVALKFFYKKVGNYFYMIVCFQITSIYCQYNFATS